MDSVTDKGDTIYTKGGLGAAFFNLRLYLETLEGNVAVGILNKR